MLSSEQIFWAAMRDALRVGRKGERQFGDLLDRHAGCHAGDDYLDDFGGILPQHVCPEDVLVASVGDELAESLLAAVRDRAKAGRRNAQCPPRCHGRGAAAGSVRPTPPYSGSVKLALGTTS